jgi:hypothetical protein
MRIKFDTWKAEYQPRIYDQSSEMCEEEAHVDYCDCEFLYTVDLAELAEDEEDHAAGHERRLWTWRGDGTIVSGIEDVRGDILITVKPYSEYTMVYHP